MGRTRDEMNLTGHETVLHLTDREAFALEDALDGAIARSRIPENEDALRGILRRLQANDRTEQEMATYIYREDCGEAPVRFEAESDDAAEDYVLKTLRSDGNPDFDGDSAQLFRIETGEDYAEPGEEFEVGICSFAGENMIPDFDGLR